MLPTVHEYLAARGPSSWCLCLSGCFAVGRKCISSPNCTIFWGTQQFTMWSSQRPQKQFACVSAVTQILKLRLHSSPHKRHTLLMPNTMASETYWQCNDCTYQNLFEQKGCVMCGAGRRIAKKAKPSCPPLRPIDANVSSSPACLKDPPKLLKVAVSAQKKSSSTG